MLNIVNLSVLIRSETASSRDNEKNTIPARNILYVQKKVHLSCFLTLQVELVSWPTMVLDKFLDQEGRSAVSIRCSDRLYPNWTPHLPPFPSKNCTVLPPFEIQDASIFTPCSPFNNYFRLFYIELILVTFFPIHLSSFFLYLNIAVDEEACCQNTHRISLSESPDDFLHDSAKATQKIEGKRNRRWWFCSSFMLILYVNFYFSLLANTGLEFSRFL